MQEITSKFPNLKVIGTKKLTQQYKAYIKAQTKEPVPTDEFKRKYKKLLLALQQPPKRLVNQPRRSLNSSILSTPAQDKLTPDTSKTKLNKNYLKAEIPTNSSSLDSTTLKNGIAEVRNNSKKRQASDFMPARFIPVYNQSCEKKPKADQGEGMKDILKRIEESDKINFRLELVYAKNKKHRVIRLMENKFEDTWEWKSYGRESPKKIVRFKDVID